MKQVLDFRKVFGQSKSVIESICEWNEARYDREFHLQLTLDLLEEEYDEVKKAIMDKDRVELCDGFGDVFFVAVGAMWKAGYSQDDITDIFDAVEEATPIPPLPVAMLWLQLDFSNFTLPLVALSAFKDLEAELDHDQAALDVIRAICVSNHSKKIEKTAPDVKANLDKGEGYIPPTAKIEQIIEKVEKGHYHV